MSYISNKQIQKALKKYALLLELKGGGDAMKARAYVTAADTIRFAQWPLQSTSIATWAALPGIGKSIQAKVESILINGTFPELLDLEKELTPELVRLASLKGVGAKSALALHSGLGTTALLDIIEAAKNDQVAKIKGFGKAKQSSLLRLLEFAHAHHGIFRLDQAEEIAKEFVEEYGPQFQNLSIVGEVRMKRPLVSTLAFISENIIYSIEDMPYFLEKIDNRIIGFYQGLAIDIEMVTPERWGNALLEKSASFAHFAVLGEAVNQDAITEEAIYERAKLPFFPAECREGVWDIGENAVEQLSQLIQYEDVKGAIHLHTTWSDGANSLEEMVTKAKSLGWTYIVITDHSQSAAYAGGLRPDRVIAQRKEIESVQQKHPDIKIYQGIESDILKDGSLDYSDEVLASFDLIVASVHSGMEMDEATATNRLVNAVKNPYTGILGHPGTGLLTERPSFPYHELEVIRACKANDCAIEMNGSAPRQDVSWQTAMIAKANGVKLVLTADAHSVQDYNGVERSVYQARKAGLTKNDVLNSLSAVEFDHYLKQRKKTWGDNQ